MSIPVPPATSPRPTTAATSRLPPRSAARTSESSSRSGGSREALPHRSGETDQPIAAQHELAHVAVVAGFGIFEAEAALETQAPVLAAAQPQAIGVHRLVQQLHPGRVAGLAAELLGTLRGGPGRTPPGPAHGHHDHQDQQAGHGGGPSFMERSMACTCLVSAPMEMQSTPSSAIARKVERSTPPEASSGIRPSYGAPCAMRTASQRVAGSR